MVYVSNIDNGTVTVIDEISRTVQNRVSVGNFPYDIAVYRLNSITDLIYVTNTGSNTVSVINSSLVIEPPVRIESRVIKNITVGRTPAGVSMHNTNNPTPFSQLIADFGGKNLPDEQIEADYNNTINYPNNYFVAPESWRECFYTTSRKNMLSLSKGIENIVRVKPPFNKFILIALFQKLNNFYEVKEQYATICPLTQTCAFLTVFYSNYLTMYIDET